MATVKTSITDRSIEVRFLRMVMIARGLDEEELAQRAGLSLGTIRNIIADSPLYPEAKLQIERTLDVPIWTPPSQFRSRNRRSTSKPS
jgi:transcriptional regulator with XRE-family HTH domain